ncbi:MAG: Mov34/MPN/PAD-1 family protein [Lentisphaerae bacterium]|nr:Mov34/MPN/PAD-1 family protein [Lentisphaerota bacterium]
MNYNTAIVQLPLVRETNGGRIRTPEDVYRVCRDIADLAQESFHVLTLSAKHGLINRHLVSLGTADSALVHPREVFRCALNDGAVVAVVLVHSHPSGDPTPSSEDVRITRQLIEAGRIIDIRVMDHIVIGRVGGMSAVPYLSMRESGLCCFDGG